MFKHSSIVTFRVIEGNIPVGQKNVTPKTPNLPSFLALTPERKDRLTLFWSRFVDLIEI